jgi:hypothetical protein
MAVGNGNSQNKAKPNTGRRITNAHNVLAPSIMSFRNDAEGFKSLRQCALLTLSLNKDNKHGIIFLTSEDLYKERFLFFALRCFLLVLSRRDALDRISQSKH